MAGQLTTKEMKLGNVHLQAMNEAETERYQGISTNRKLLERARRDIDIMNVKSDALRAKLAKYKEKAELDHSTMTTHHTAESRK